MHHIIDSLSFNMVIIRIGHSDKANSQTALIHQVNQPAANLLAYRKEELIGQPLSLIFATEKEMVLLQSAIEKMGDLVIDNCFEGEIITKDRHKHHVLLSISPVTQAASQAY